MRSAIRMNLLALVSSIWRVVIFQLFNHQRYAGMISDSELNIINNYYNQL